MIRYYGFYNSKCQDLLDEIHRLLGNEKKAYRNRQKRKEELRSKLDKLKFMFAYDPLEGKTNDRQYRKDCIDEMRKLQLSRGSPHIHA